MKGILVTGGAGFIGSNFIKNWFKENKEAIINLDKLTYAGNLENLEQFEKECEFIKGDINDSELVKQILKDNQPRAIINFAAETHVDNSIAEPDAFINSNILGTYNLLSTSLDYFQSITKNQRDIFKFLHISTDEVFGSLSAQDPKSNESSSYRPNSPYSASKAASDHLVRAWGETYGLPINITNCTNNYGPNQHEEKLIPLIIKNCLEYKDLPIYGDGQNIRDWLYVDDHCEAIRQVLDRGETGHTYNIGGNNQTTNLDIVNIICKLLDDLKPNDKGSYSNLITFVNDRPGHDFRYSLDTTKIEKKLNWFPSETFESGLRKTVKWYLSKYD